MQHQLVVYRGSLEGLICKWLCKAAACITNLQYLCENESGKIIISNYYSIMLTTEFREIRIQQ